MDKGSTGGGQQPPEGHIFPWAPVPAFHQLGVMTMPDGQNAVILTLKTPDNQSVTFWDADSMEKMIRDMRTAIMQARTGLVLPSPNGQGEAAVPDDVEGGAVDLSKFRDQRADEYMEGDGDDDAVT